MTVTTSNQAGDTARKHTSSITPRIIAMLAACDRFDQLTSEQIWRLDGGSRQKVTRILQKCTELRLLAQPGGQRSATTAFFDARPRVFGLTRKGAQLLADAGV